MATIPSTILQFINHILKGDHGLKIAVIENEFGEVSILSQHCFFNGD